jgi:hypothetical protein
MFEDPHIIRLNIRHLETVLQLRSMAEQRPQIMTLLQEARSQLPMAEAEAAGRAA